MAGQKYSLLTKLDEIDTRYSEIEKQLSEPDYRKLILEEYTFLKRPVIIIGEEIFIGNAKKVVEAVVERLRLESL